MRIRATVSALSWLVASLVGGGSADALSIDWVTIGSPGNAADPTMGLGSVSYTYQISKFEITNAQYTEFLNAIAATDTNALFDPRMGSNADGGILRSGSSGTFAYAAKTGQESQPVSYVSFNDAMRFSNWLHNGQLTGAQDTTTTEDGAYTITLSGLQDNSITRNGAAEIAVTNGNEWYKAAYYDGAGGYFTFPTGSDGLPSCSPPSPAPNSANCFFRAGGPTDVGAYTGSASPLGTFDQGGNVFEWTEDIDGTGRIRRGGSRGTSPFDLASYSSRTTSPGNNGGTNGFRIVQVVPIPEPGTALLVAGGLVGLGLRRGACRRKR